MPMSSFDLDEVTNLVQRHGIAARLSEQEKRLLVLLAAHAGTALDKRVLMDTLWGRRAQWMEDAAIVQLVSRLRRSLAPLGLQRAIVTVARIGYRFDPPVHDASQASAIEGPLSGDGAAAEIQVTDASLSATHDAVPLHSVAREGHGEVCRNGIVVRIPQIEYRLLLALLSPPHVAHDKRTLIAQLWPERPDQDDTNLMQVVSRLRRKLIPLDLHRHIVTVPRMGYRFAPVKGTRTPSVNPSVTSGATTTAPAASSCPGVLRQHWRGLCARFQRSLTRLTRHLRWHRH